MGFYDILKNTTILFVEWSIFVHIFENHIQCHPYIHLPPSFDGFDHCFFKNLQSYAGFCDVFATLLPGIQWENDNWIMVKYPLHQSCVLITDISLHPVLLLIITIHHNLAPPNTSALQITPPDNSAHNSNNYVSLVWCLLGLFLDT